MSNHVLVFGCGPMPCEPDGAVMAPGGRTWQLVRTVSSILAKQPEARLTVYCLEGQSRAPFVVRAGDMGATIVACSIEDFVALPKVLGSDAQLKSAPPRCIVGGASIQPCCTAVEVAEALGVPVWADIFGDPISEVQSAAPISGELNEEHESRLLHVWRLLTKTLAGADGFSALSGPQRLALIGQLGCVGRLNSATAGQELVHSIPYGLWPDELPPVAQLPPSAEFHVLWSGSFNTWTDPEILGEGIAKALQEEPCLRFDILGGAIAGYHESGYARFQNALTEHQAPLDRINLLDWQPYKSLPAAYARCHAALCLDRWTYEAVLGSRTRVVHMLFAGRPVISTALSELTAQMAQKGVLFSVTPGSADSLAGRLVELARTNREQLDFVSAKCRQVALEACHGERVAAPLLEWLAAPRLAADKPTSPTNALLPYWQRAVKS